MIPPMKVSSIDFPNNFSNNLDLSWDLEAFKKNFNVVITKLTKLNIEFDFIGLDASIANSLRRYMLAEVPTMAIETVYVKYNDGIMADEVLAHRLGLVPLKVDPRQFEFSTPGENPTDLNTLVFKLDAFCRKNTKALKDAVHPSEKYLNSSVYSSNLEWVPQGEQAEKFEDVKAVDEDIILTKMRPGQQINLEMFAVKGVGQDHVKFSPITKPGCYRLLPEIKILKPILNEEAKLFQSCFSKGVIDLVENNDGDLEAKVVNPRLDTVSRNVFMHPEFEVDVESSGIYPPHVIVKEGLLGLIEKCKKIKEALE
ncbi:DNA-directed RNA polymerases I and III subunit RPAC1 [Clydaea vesicula]|uniref:DNA-directed RNA polymerases I and III subunit RPAC1 n=1 Tax=Clydaea vesicula TaxID=447962 RepID=A0AAD5TVC7_9FUNG|nr:DNA-directed RNA polymerases I and III subunit RPAC1 [Clydaea vesicula]